MNDGFVKAAAISTRVTVADPESNCEEVCGGILKAASLGAKIMVFPELCLTLSLIHISEPTILDVMAYSV